MSLNNKMHPRNIYRKPPDFKELALKYPELRSYAKPDLNGKVQIDFKNQDALRVLLKVLLKNDFDLNIEMPPEKLVPTLPLRLNYILWIEDLVQNANLSNPIGIDIGVGASCVYPLLAAKKNNWQMLGTETDAASYSNAIKNVEINNLQSLITVVKVNEDTILDGAIDPNKDYTFCMCNPPFYSNVSEICGKSRSPDSRAPPRNARTGVENEVVTEGGEVAFIGKIIEDSKKLQNKIKIYTSMVGIKSNLKTLINLLKSSSAASITQTSFCQGRTMRWGLAWTYDKSINFPVVPVPKKSNEKPLQQEFYPPYTVESVEKDVLALMDRLEIKYTEIKKNSSVKVFELTAYKNTWSNQRKKRREEKRKQIAENCSAGVEATQSDVNPSHTAAPIKNTHMELDSSNLKRKPDGSLDTASESKLAENDLKKSKLVNVSSLIGSPNKRKVDTTSLETPEIALDMEHENFKRLRLDSDFEELFNATSCLEYSANDPLLVCTLGVRNLKTKILIDMVFVDGTGGKEAMNQVLLYIRNNMKQNILEIL